MSASLVETVQKSDWNPIKKKGLYDCPVQNRVLLLCGILHCLNDLGCHSGNLWLLCPRHKNLFTEHKGHHLRGWGQKWSPECCFQPRASCRELFSEQALVMCLPYNSSHVQRPNKLSCNPVGKDQSWYFLPYCICFQKSRRIYLW